MKKLINSLLIVVLFMVTSNNVQAAETITTHLRMTPGKVVIKEQVKPGKKIYLYRYYVKNASTNTKVVHLSSTGNLIVKEESVTIKPQEKYYFDVYLKVPYSEKKKERSDYVVAQTLHNEDDSMKLEAKVEYKIVSLKTTILNDSIWFFVGAFVILVLLMIIILKKHKKKKADGNKKINIETNKVPEEKDESE
ncbi:hypothetical protein AAGG74_15975 [Bacillus mexicanus]|uniref:hypothetical protein n=1 Tax=Bacillus mexicanus TaxID=2834415 RepID=UPI003D1B0D56